MIRKTREMIKETIHQLVYYQGYQKFLKISWISRALHTLKIFFFKQTSFSRGFNSHHCLLVMLEKFRKVLEKGDSQICQVFGSIPLDLIITKRHASTLHKKWNFPLRISSVNVTKSAVSYEFGHIYWINP